jgi:hypothetical protein
MLLGARFRLTANHLLTQSEQLLEPGSIGDFAEREMNEVEDYDHKKNGFITDLQVDGHLSSIILSAGTRTTRRHR